MNSHRTYATEGSVKSAVRIHPEESRPSDDEGSNAKENKMGKLKTNKSVSKRFRRTKTGKFKRMRAGKRHLLEGKSSKRKRHLRGTAIVVHGTKDSLRRLMPYA